MTGFSIPEAAFSGFRIARKHPRALAVWAALQLAVSLILGLVLVAAAGPALMQLQAMAAAAPADPTKALAAVSGLLPTYALILPFVLILTAVQNAAMNRVVLTPELDRFGYLRLGRDELRQLALLLLGLVVFFGVYIGLVMVVTIAATIATLALKASGLIVAMLGALAAVGAFLYLAARLSLASALTFATGKVDLFGSWRLTHGRLRPLLLTYAIALISAVVVYLLTMVIIYAAGAAVGGAGAQPDMSSIRAYLTPATLIQIVLSAGASALVLPLIGAPPAAIYRQIAAGRAWSGAAGVFS